MGWKVSLIPLSFPFINPLTCWEKTKLFGEVIKLITASLCRVRLFSAATSKPLGTLVSHRETVHALAFAHLAFSPSQPIALTDNETSSAETETATTEYPESTVNLEDDDDSDADDEVDSISPRERWLASGGKDGKVALWGLMDFSATG